MYPYFFWGWHDRQIEHCDDNVFYLASVSDYRVPGIGNSTQVTDSTYEDWLNLGFDRHSIIADPRFVDPARDNYNIQPDSPALKLGFKPIDLSDIGIRPDLRNS